jgi:hypothetical protein
MDAGLSRRGFLASVALGLTSPGEMTQGPLLTAYDRTQQRIRPFRAAIESGVLWLGLDTRVEEDGLERPYVRLRYQAEFNASFTERARTALDRVLRTPVAVSYQDRPAMLWPNRPRWTLEPGDLWSLVWDGTVRRLDEQYD